MNACRRLVRARRPWLARLATSVAAIAAAIALLGVVEFVVSCNSAFAAGPRDEVWRQVKKAEEDGQLELALRRLKPLEAELRRDADWAALSRAIVQRVVLEEAIAEGYKHLSEGNWNHAALTARIVRLTEACATAPRETKPLLNFVLYSWYRDQLNFYHLKSEVDRRFKSKGVRRPSQRKFEMDDWDRARIQVAVVAQLDKLLAEEAVMRQMPIERLDDWLGDGNLPATYRPTVFDWVAFQVSNMLDLDIGERRLFGTDVAELPPLAELFSDREAFLKFEFRWRPHQVLEDRAFRWLKRRIGAHLDDADPTALVAADLARLMFMIDISGRSAVDAYERALRRLAERLQSHESVSLVYHDLADLLISQDRTKEGVEAAQRGATAFPASIGAQGCRRLLALARTSKIELQLSHDSPARCGVLQVNSERAPRIELRLVKLDWNEELSVIYRRLRGEPNDDAPEDDVADAGTDDYETVDLRRWLKRPVSRRWSLTFDQSLGEQQTKNLALPEDLAPGCYVILACRDDRFSLDASPAGDDGATPVVGEPLVVALKFWSGSMKLVQSAYGLRGIQGIVLDARTGSPLQGARPRVWELGIKQMREIQLPESLVTDQHGRFMIDVGEQHAKYIVMVERGNETSGCWLTSAEWPFQRARSNADWNEKAEKPSIEFQLDRRSYRPGESVAFWGQVRGPARRGFRPARGQEVVIRWSDSLAIASLSDADSSTPASEKSLSPERRKGSTMILATDEFGVFSGRISLSPTISETTTASLYASTKVVSKSASIIVEPIPAQTFAVDWQLDRADARATGPIRVCGVVRDSDGRPVARSRIEWRVESMGEEVPNWFDYDYKRIKELGAGRIETDFSGRFSFVFNADRDGDTRRWQGLSFKYMLYVEAIDATGRRATKDRSFVLRSSDCVARIEADNWVSDGEETLLKLSTRSYADRPVPARGKLFVLKHSEAQGRRFGLMHSEAGDKHDDECVIEIDWETRDDGTWQRPVRLPVGAFTISVDGADAQGGKCFDRRSIWCVPADRRLALQTEFYFPLERRDSYAPGELMEWLWSGEGLRRRLSYRIRDGLIEPLEVSELDANWGITRYRPPADASAHETHFQWLNLRVFRSGAINSGDDDIPLVDQAVGPDRFPRNRLRLTVDREKVADAGREGKQNANGGGRGSWRVTVRDAEGKPVQARTRARIHESSASYNVASWRPFQGDVSPGPVGFYDFHNTADVRGPYWDSAADLQVVPRDLKQEIERSLQIRAKMHGYDTWRWKGFGRTGPAPYDPFSERRQNVRDLSDENPPESERSIQYLTPVLTSAEGTAVLSVDLPALARDRQLEVWAIDREGREQVLRTTIPALDGSGQDGLSRAGNLGESTTISSEATRRRTGPFRRRIPRRNEARISP